MMKLCLRLRGRENREFLDFFIFSNICVRGALLLFQKIIELFPGYYYLRIVFFRFFVLLRHLLKYRF